MTDELKAAAERMRADDYPQHATDPDDPRHIVLREGDTRLLARAYLADNPADSGDAITADWLRGCGFREVGAWRELRLESDAYTVVGTNPKLLAAEFADLDVANRWHVENFDDSLPVPAPATRGDLRRLCAALGVPLTEGV